MRPAEPVPFTAIDVHAHVVGRDTRFADEDAPHLVVESGEGAIVRGGMVLRTLAPGAWDVTARLAELDSAGVSHQVVSPFPVFMEHAWTADPSYARDVNDSIAAAVDESGGRLIGLGCLPRQEPETELARCLAMGLRGVLVGTRMGGLDLDEPAVAGLWAACERLDACVFVHPVEGGRGVVRRGGAPFDVGMGMLVDTGLAAAALVLGGVLARHPALRVALAHGGGTYPWVYPRLRLAAEQSGIADGDWSAATARLYADSILLDPVHLGLVEHRLGPSRLMLGSDAPFFPVADALAAVDDALASGALRATTRADLLVANASHFLGLPPSDHHSRRVR
ncbi:amidohydrolase family protein [Aeromicrobium sp. P5_D10]